MQPGRLLLSSWPWRSVTYLGGYVIAGLVSWAAFTSIILFPVWAGVWARWERQLAGLVGGEQPLASPRGGVSWRALVHCLVSGVLAAVGVQGGLLLVAVAMSTVLAPLQPLVPFQGLWFTEPSTAGEYVLAALFGVVLLPVVLWLLVCLAVGVDALSAGILAPRAEALSRQLSTLRAASVRAEDDVLAERRRLQQQLHDGVQLHLSVTGTRLAVLEYDIDTLVSDPQRAELLRAVGDVRDHLQVAMAEVRGAVSGLAPRVLVDEGLCAAVHDLVEGVPFDVVVRCDVPRLAATTESDLYLMIAECLTNVVKHAQARNVDIALGTDGTEVEVTVADDGAGGVGDPGRGLLGLTARAERHNGTVQIDSPPGRGTTVRIRVKKGAP